MIVGIDWALLEGVTLSEDEFSMYHFLYQIFKLWGIHGHYFALKWDLDVSYNTGNHFSGKIKAKSASP